MMNSIIRIYNGENNEDEGIINDRFMKYYYIAADSINDKTGQQISDLLLLPYMPSTETIKLLAQPWLRANMVISMIDSFNTTEEKCRITDIIHAIKHLRNLFHNWPKTSLNLLLFRFSEEPNIDKLSFYLHEVEIFLTKYAEMNFSYGSGYCSTDMKRYAIDSLFWIGKTMELKETGRSNQLSKYIKIITGFHPEEFSEHHHKYKKKYKHQDFLTQYNQNQNYFFNFIFNPTCQKTIEKLNYIRLLKNSRKLADTP